MIFLKGVITIFCDNAGISHNRVTEPLETLFHYDINGVQKVIRQLGLTTKLDKIGLSVWTSYKKVNLN